MSGVIKDGVYREIKKRREATESYPSDIWWCPFCDHSSQEHVKTCICGGVLSDKIAVTEKVSKGRRNGR